MRDMSCDVDLEALYESAWRHQRKIGGVGTLYCRTLRVIRQDVSTSATTLRLQPLMPGGVREPVIRHQLRAQPRLAPLYKEV